MKVVRYEPMYSAIRSVPLPTAICVHCGVPVAVRAKDLHPRIRNPSNDLDQVIAFPDERAVVCCDACESRDQQLEIPNTREIAVTDAWTPAIVEVTYRVLVDPQPLHRSRPERPEEV